MIQITDKFSAHKYTHGWELHEKCKGKNRNNEMVDIVKKDYWPNLHRLCCSVMDKELADCEDLKQCIDKIDEFSETVKRVLKPKPVSFL